MKKVQFTIGEALDRDSFVHRCGISNNNVLCTTVDGAGKQTLGWAFAGSVINVPTQHSDTNEFNPKFEWSNGRDTKDIEAKLRRTKKKFGYTEVNGHGGKRRGAGRPKQN